MSESYSTTLPPSSFNGLGGVPGGICPANSPSGTRARAFIAGSCRRQDINDCPVRRSAGLAKTTICGILVPGHRLHPSRYPSAFILRVIVHPFAFILRHRAKFQHGIPASGGRKSIVHLYATV